MSASPSSCVPVLRVVGAETISNEKDKPYVTYLISVSAGVGHSWRVSRRYRQFRQLHEDLKSAFKKLQLPELPKKSLQRSFKQAYIEKKQDELEEYLQGLLRITEVTGSEIFCSFLVSTFAEVFESDFRASQESEKLMKEAMSAIEERADLLATRDALTEQISDLNISVRERMSEQDEIRSENERLKGELVHLADLEKAKQDAERLVKDRDSEVETLKSTSQALRSELAEALEKIAILEAGAADTQKRFTDTAVQHERAMSELKEGHQSALDELSQRSREQIEELRRLQEDTLAARDAEQERLFQSAQTQWEAKLAEERGSSEAAAAKAAEELKAAREALEEVQADAVAKLEDLRRRAEKDLADSITEWEAQRAQLVQVSQSNIQRLEEQLAESEKARKAEEERVADLESELDEARTSFATEKQDLEMEIGRLRAEHEDTEKMLQEFRRSKADQEVKDREQQSALRDELSEARASEQQLQSQVQKLQEHLAGLKSELESETHALQESKDASVKAASDLATLQQDLTRLTTEREALARTAEAAQTELADWKAQHSSLQQSHNLALEQVASAELRGKELLAQLEAQTQRTESQKSEHIAELERLREERTNSQAQESEAASLKIESLEQKNNSLVQELEGLRRERDDMLKQLRDVSDGGEVANLAAQFTEQQERHNQALRDRETQIQSIQAEYSQSMEQLREQMQKSLRDLGQEKDIMKLRHAEELGAVRKDLAAAEADLKELREQCSELSSRCRSLEGALAEAEAEHAEALAASSEELLTARSELEQLSRDSRAREEKLRSLESENRELQSELRHSQEIASKESEHLSELLTARQESLKASLAAEHSRALQEETRRQEHQLRGLIQSHEENLRDVQDRLESLQMELGQEREKMLMMEEQLRRKDSELRASRQSIEELEKELEEAEESAQQPAATIGSADAAELQSLQRVLAQLSGKHREALEACDAMKDERDHYASIVNATKQLAAELAKQMDEIKKQHQLELSVLQKQETKNTRALQLREQEVVKLTEELTTLREAAQDDDPRQTVEELEAQLQRSKDQIERLEAVVQQMSPLKEKLMEAHKEQQAYLQSQNKLKQQKRLLVAEVKKLRELLKQQQRQQR